VLAAEGFQPTLSKLVDVLERLRIRYHLTGGITSVAYGEPRMTQDLDLVLDPDRARAVRDEFLSALSSAGLIWIQHGSHRSRRDLRRILAAATPEELATVRHTAGEMDLTDLLDEVLAERDEIDA
jgi:hypothetical protein